jgi:hypothetical protein
MLESRSGFQYGVNAKNYKKDYREICRFLGFGFDVVQFEKK